MNDPKAENVADLQHEEWVARRAKPTRESIAKALEILDRPTGHAPEEQDRLPKGYVPVRRKRAKGGNVGRVS
jgi:hypothetical protein